MRDRIALPSVRRRSFVTELTVRLNFLAKHHSANGTVMFTARYWIGQTSTSSGSSSPGTNVYEVVCEVYDNADAACGSMDFCARSLGGNGLTLKEVC